MEDIDVLNLLEDLSKDIILAKRHVSRGNLDRALKKLDGVLVTMDMKMDKITDELTKQSVANNQCPKCRNQLISVTDLGFTYHKCVCGWSDGE